MNHPAILRKLVLKQTLLRFLGGELFLIGILLLADLFTSMWRLLAIEAPLGSILRWVISGLPAHAMEVLPIAFLFGITLTLAELHADGEFLVICGSGISLQSLALPLIVFSLMMGGVLFFAGDLFTIPASVERDRIFRQMTGQKSAARQSTDITIIAEGGRFVYSIGAFDPETPRLIDIDIIGRDEAGKPNFRLISSRALWSQDHWVFSSARIFSIAENNRWTEKTIDGYSNPLLVEKPASFGILREKPSLMKTTELSMYVEVLKNSGLPFVEAETEYYKRLSFLLTPLIVCGLSVAASGWFRKNSLLMSLLFSLGTATVYYVAQMLGSLAAKTGWIAPMEAVWGVTLVFVALAALGYSKAKS